MYTFYRLYDKYAHSSNDAVRELFKTMNKNAMYVAFKHITDPECNLLLIKIYLYLGHYYMDLQCYDRALAYAVKCRFFSMDMNDSICSEVNYKKNNIIIYFVV